MRIERSNETWISDLQSSGDEQDAALRDLRGIIQRGLPYGLSRWLSPSHPQFDEFMEEVAQYTLLRVLDQLHTFEGRSKFSTWVHKIAIRIALSELRRKRWQDRSLDNLIDQEEGLAFRGLLHDSRAGPEVLSERNNLLERVRSIIVEELTDKQRTAMMAIGIQGMPIGEVARRMNTNRNALYKLMHDARVKLKDRLTKEGLSPTDILGIFEQE